MSRRVAICTTTISPIGPFAEAYVRNIQHYGHTRDVVILIAGDRKSPPDCENTALAISAASGLPVKFLTPAWQDDYLSKYPDLAAIIPYNSDNRRNVAFLLALEEGADLILSVDDDNYPTADCDFVGSHLAATTTPVSLPEATGAGGWYNLCSQLVSGPCGDRSPDLFPRGFPYKKRVAGTGALGPTVSATPSVNAGLWIGDPDVDAITRLSLHPTITSWTGQSVLLAERVLTPINTQNTALHREAICAYYYVRMGVTLDGQRLDRFGDIFSGFFLQLCARAAGDRIRIGSPIVEHRRHPHDLLADLQAELPGILLVEDLCDFLAGVVLPRGGYAQAYRSLSHLIERYGAEYDGRLSKPPLAAYARDMGAWMRIWADVTSLIK